MKNNPIGKDINEGKIIEYIGKNLIYAKDRCIGRLNRGQNSSIQPEEENALDPNIETE